MVFSDDQSRRETAEVQQETLSTVANLIGTVDELKHTLGPDINEMQRLHSEHAVAFAEIRKLQDEHRREISALMETRQEVARQEHQLKSWRSELEQVLRAEIKTVE